MKDTSSLQIPRVRGYNVLAISEIFLSRLSTAYLLESCKTTHSGFPEHGTQVIAAAAGRIQETVTR